MIHKNVKYVNTLRAREFTIDAKDLLKILGLPIEDIVDIYYEPGAVHIITELKFVDATFNIKYNRG